MRTIEIARALILAAGGLVSVSAFGQVLPAPVFSTFADQANRVIPGSGGQVFNTGGIDLVRVSSSGGWWILKGNRVYAATPPATGQDITRDEVVVAGTATASSVVGTLVLGERDPYPAFATGLQVGEVPGTVVVNGPASINNSGRFIISTLSPAPVASNANRVLLRGQLSVQLSGLPGVTALGVYGREGSELPGVPGYNFGQDIFADGITDSGEPLFRSQRMAGNKQALMLGSTVLAETVDGARTWPYVDAELTIPDANYYQFVPFGSAPNPMVTPDGSHWALVGQLTGAVDMLVVDGQTLIRDFDFLPGEVDFVILDVGLTRLASNGRWITRVSTGVSNYVRSGDVNLARSGVACVPCFAQAWRERYALDPNTGQFADSVGFGNVAINAWGRWVISGLTNSSDPNDNSLVVVDGRTVLLRERQPMDLDGDGVANDDAVLLGLNNDSVQLTDDGWLWFIANVNRPAASALAGADVNGSVLYRVRLPALACGRADIAGPGQGIGADGELTADDIIVYLNAFFAGNLCADVSGPGQETVTLDGELTADDIIVFLNRFFGGC